MATIKTIKPDGTGDFTTLAAWSSWASTQATADQWAECYGGGDLGTASTSGWTAVSDATHYPRIYSHASSRPTVDCVNWPPATGAYMVGTGTAAALTVTQKFAQVDGITVYKNNLSGSLVSLGISGAGVTVVNNFLRRDGAATSAAALTMQSGSTGSAAGPTLIANNVVYVADTAAAGSQSAFNVGDNGGADALTVANNTLILNKKNGTGINVTATAGNTANVKVFNNAVYGIDFAGGQTSILDAADAGAYEHNATYSNNATDDGYPANYGDANFQAITGADFFSATNPGPSANSKLIDHGATVAAVTTDIFGTARPQGSAYDIGAIEASSGGGGTGSLSLGRAPLGNGGPL